MGMKKNIELEDCNVLIIDSDGSLYLRIEPKGPFDITKRYYQETMDIQSLKTVDGIAKLLEFAIKYSDKIKQHGNDSAIHIKT